MRQYYVYIMSSRNRTLYVGVTNNLLRRAYEHQHKLADGFTKKYNVSSVVFYDTTNDVEAAIAREKQLKGWRRSKKIALIELVNPGWNALSLAWYR